jgi:hypothetical protein
MAWHAVEAPTNLNHRFGAVVVDGEICPRVARAIAEQLDRLVGQGQRRHLPDHLTAHH